MIDHMSLPVSDYQRSKAFCLKADGHNIEAVCHAPA